MSSCPAYIIQSYLKVWIIPHFICLFPSLRVIWVVFSVRWWRVKLQILLHPVFCVHRSEHLSEHKKYFNLNCWSYFSQSGWVCHVALLPSVGGSARNSIQTRYYPCFSFHLSIWTACSDPHDFILFVKITKVTVVPMAFIYLLTWSACPSFGNSSVIPVYFILYNSIKCALYLFKNSVAYCRQCSR